MPWLRRRKLEPLLVNGPSGPATTVPLVEVQVVARTYAEARHAAQLMGLGDRDWRFVHDDDRFRGRYQGMAVFYGDWFLRDDADELQQIARTYEMDVWMLDDTFPGFGA